MSEPKEVSKELIEHLNDFMDCVHPFRLGGHCPECHAIRRLIEERGEWEKKIRRFRRRAMVLKEAADETGVWIENIEKFLGDVIHELGKVG